MFHGDDIIATIPAKASQFTPLAGKTGEWAARILVLLGHNRGVRNTREVTCLRRCGLDLVAALKKLIPSALQHQPLIGQALEGSGNTHQPQRFACSGR